MILDFSKINFQGLDTTNKIVMFQVYHFPFYVNYGKQAHIQIMQKEDGYGSQAKILNNYSKMGSVSSGKTFATAEEAMNDVIKLVLNEILEDPNIHSGKS